MQQKTSNKVCPDNMTIEEWQISLRKENAIASKFEVKHIDNNRIWGDYSVQNNHGSYKVAFRGVCSDRNYCSCLDFRTNGLGTCKHIESVMLFLQTRVPGYPWGGMDFNPEYTSIYVSYKGGRSIKIRVGTTFVDEFNALKNEYFDASNTLPEENYCMFDEIYQRAMSISVNTKIYDDVKDFVKEVISHQQWNKELERTYPDNLIPWDKNNVNSNLYNVEKYLYDITKQGSGVIVCQDTRNIPHIVARLSEEIYQGEIENNKGYVIVDNDADITLYHDALKSYSESSVLPISVVTHKGFIDIYSKDISDNENISFVYVSNADCLKEWKNQLSIVLKKLNISHLYMQLQSLKDLSSVQLSSILQHISPFVIGPFYKFIHTYRHCFPLNDIQDELPLEVKDLIFIVNGYTFDADLSLFTDISISFDRDVKGGLRSKSKDNVDKFLLLFKEILKDPEAISLLLKKLENN